MVVVVDAPFFRYMNEQGFLEVGFWTVYVQFKYFEPRFELILMIQVVHIVNFIENYITSKN